MEIINVIMSIFLIASVNGYVLNYDDEDRIFDMLLSDYYISNEPDLSTDVTKHGELKPVFVNGVWLCGNCSNISKLNLLYNESYYVENTYDEELELQVGLSLDNMQCVQVNTDEDVEVEIVSGACAGDDGVTLKMMNTNNCDIWIYG